ncbi:vacuolar cation/proton exchanger 3-like [Primulina huaijiensis]|uniref:vacuolar cation/proton exchanger 3-like n=1 Tax=Primulina huaijiensis TaxID=1492673 RepID=UPI003CC78CAD
MGSVHEKVEVESDEEIPLGESQTTDKIQSFNFDTPSTSQYPMVNRFSLLRSIYVVLIKGKINFLLPFVPLTIMLHYLSEKHGWIFFFSLLGITPLAERLGYATEQLSFYTGPTVGGLLNATFGNATEMIISMYALKNGMIRVVQLSLLGSILSNMLLVLGCAFFCGGIHHQKVQKFTKETALVNSGLLLMAVMGLLFPAVLHFTHTELHKGKSELSLSRFSSCIMLVAYTCYIFFQLKRQKDLYTPLDEVRESNEEEDSNENEEPEISQWEALAWLAIFTSCIFVLSGYLVDALQGASDSMNMPVAFISVILLPIVGNAAEHASAIMFAVKDKLDITIGVAIGSSTQISMFVIPFCVIVGWFMGKSMDLNFQLFETAVLFITVLVVTFMLQDGQSNYFKGLMLVLCYLIVGASFFVHIDPSNGGS